MKKFITNISLLLIATAGFAQIDVDAASNSTNLYNVERTPALEILYQKAIILSETGTPEQINENRLAIKSAWEEVNPEIAALYKPIQKSNVRNFSSQNSGNKKRRNNPLNTRDGNVAIPENFNLSTLVHGGYVDALSMDVAMDGKIYILAYENRLDYSGEDDRLMVFLSVNNGVSFDKIIETYGDVGIKKLKIISFDGHGDQYLGLYILTNTNSLDVISYNLSNNFAQDYGIISSDITDFDLDRNYPTNTNQQRVFATYIKDGKVNSSRSIPGTYGKDWQDEFERPLFVRNISMSYGRDGSVYTAYMGSNSGNLRVNINSNFNDPASWLPTDLTLEDGANKETLKVVIAAARKHMAQDNVLVWGSQRAAGSNNKLDGVSYRRVNNGSFSNGVEFSSGSSEWNISHPHAWTRRVNDVSTIRTSYVRDNILNSENDMNRSLTYNGTQFDPFVAVADPAINVYDGYASVTAEIINYAPCMAFAGTHPNDNPFNLYFSTEDLLKVNSNPLENLAIYPVPTKNVIHVSAKNTIENIDVISILGNTVMQFSPQTNEFQMDTSSLSSGVYFLKITAEGSTVTRKIIKE